MAKIEDLIAQIPDERLKAALGAEVKAIKKTKKFGLVFEDHLPETVRLPKLQVREGAMVALKRWTFALFHQTFHPAVADRRMKF